MYKSKMALITFGANAYNFGMRSIAAYLRERGHQVILIYCKLEGDSVFGLLSKKQLEIITEKCTGMNAIGISILSTHYFNQAVQINNFIKKKLNIPIVFGGIAVICDPSFYVQSADYVCVGEGEVFLDEFLEKIVRGERIENTDGLAYKSPNGEIIFNRPIPLVDLDKIPLPLLDLNNTFILTDRLTSLKEDPAPLIKLSRKGYRIFPIRGCPFSCTFCSNNKIRNVYRGNGRLIRRLSNTKVIEELEQAKQLIPSIDKIFFYEDDFFIRDDAELDDLMTLYKGKINLPFSLNATIKNSTKSKLDIIQNKSLTIEFMKVGLQSPNERVNREIYCRPFNKKEFIDKITLLTKRGIPVVIDVISENPYETIEDKREALKFYLQLSKKLTAISDSSKLINLMDHKLMYYPGTALYSRALKDRIISENYISEVLLTRRTTRSSKDMDIDKIILSIFKFSLKPNCFFLQWLMRFLILPGVIKEINKPIFYRLLNYLTMLSKVKFHGLTAVISSPASAKPLSCRQAGVEADPPHRALTDTLFRISSTKRSGHPRLYRLGFLRNCLLFSKQTLQRRER